MPHELLIQPNGKFCIFTTIVDNILIYDMDEDEVMEHYYERDRRRLREWKESDYLDGITAQENLLNILQDNLFERAKNRSFDDSINWIAVTHGPDEANNNLKMMGEPERDFTEFLKKVEEERNSEE